MPKQAFAIKNSDLEQIEELLKSDKQTTKVHNRCTFLKCVSEGENPSKISKLLGVSRTTIYSWKSDYLEKGLRFLYDAPKTGRPPRITGLSKAKITALACSEAPEGHAVWTLRLLSDRIVQLDICPQISHTEVANILKKTNFNRT